MNHISFSAVWAALVPCVDRDARRYGVQAVAAMLVGSLCTLGGAAALALAVSEATESARAAGVWLLVAVAAGAAGRMLDVVKARAYALAEFSLERSLTRRVFRAAVGADRQTPVGAQLQSLTTIILGGRLIFQHALFTAPSAVIDAVFAAAFLVLFGQAWVAAFLVVFASVYMWLSFRLAAPIGECAHDVADGRMASSALFGDALLNRDAVRWYGALDFVTASFDRAFGRVARDTLSLTDARARAAWIAAFSFAIGYGATLTLAWLGADDPATRVRDIVLANMCVLTLIRPLEQAGQAMRDIVLARAWVAPLTQMTEPAPLAVAPAAPGKGVSISVRNVSFGYGDADLFQSISFEVGKGAILGLKGESGVGKTTLLRLLIGDQAPREGEVLWDYGSLPPSFSVASQETLLLDDTVAANIAFGRNVAAMDIERAAAVVGLDVVLADSGRDLSFRVGERGRGLSGGERQRLALARAVLEQRSLYILDEATSALDPEAERAVLSRVVAAVRGGTIVVVSHRESAFALCDSIVEIGATGAVASRRALRANAGTAAASMDRDPHSLEARI